jgi:hypothetical protein
VLGGTTWGVAGGLIVLPLISALACAASITESEECGMAEVYVLAGISRLRHEVTTLSCAVLVSIAALPASALGGAVVGLGDAIRQHGSFLGPVQAPPPLVPVFAIVAYFVAIAAATAAITRRRTWSLGSLSVAYAAFVPAVYATRRTGGYTWLARAFPWSPLWSRFHRTKDLYWLQVSTHEAILVFATWTILSAAAVKMATRAGRATAPRRRIPLMASAEVHKLRADRSTPPAC